MKLRMILSAVVLFSSTAAFPEQLMIVKPALTEQAKPASPVQQRAISAAPISGQFAPPIDMGKPTPALGQEKKIDTNGPATASVCSTCLVARTTVQ
jgi:hypothetical protein